MQRWVGAGRALLITLPILGLYACHSTRAPQAVVRDDVPECELPPYDANPAAIEKHLLPSHRRPASLRVIDCGYERSDRFETVVLEACSFAIDPMDVPDLTRFKTREKVRKVGTFRPPVVARLAERLPLPLDSIRSVPGELESFYLDADLRHGVMMASNSRCPPQIQE